MLHLSNGDEISSRIRMPFCISNQKVFYENSGYNIIEYRMLFLKSHCNPYISMINGIFNMEMLKIKLKLIWKENSIA